MLYQLYLNKIFNKKKKKEISNHLEAKGQRGSESTERDYKREFKKEDRKAKISKTGQKFEMKEKRRKEKNRVPVKVIVPLTSLV